MRSSLLISHLVRLSYLVSRPYQAPGGGGILGLCGECDLTADSDLRPSPRRILALTSGAGSLAPTPRTPVAERPACQTHAHRPLGGSSACSSPRHNAVADFGFRRRLRPGCLLTTLGIAEPHVKSNSGDHDVGTRRTTQEQLQV